MRKFEDLSGQRFGKLVVLRRSEDTIGGRVAWVCKCDCGSIDRLARTDWLKSGSTKSCGCILHLDTAVLPPGYTEAIRCYRHGAKKRGYSWELSRRDAYNLMIGNCHYCGAPPKNIRTVDRSVDKQKFIYSGIDRKDNSIGYTLSNSVSCCARCNIAKRAMGYTEFLDFIKSVYEHLIAK